MFSRNDIAFLNSLATRVEAQNKYLESDKSLPFSKTVTDGEWYWNVENTTQLFELENNEKKYSKNVFKFYPRISRGIKIRRTLNGFIIIDSNSLTAIKMLDKNREPNFIKNELMANQHYPRISNPVASSFELGGYNVFASQLLPKMNSINEPQMQEVIQTLFVAGKDASWINLSEYKSQIVNQIVTFTHPSRELRKKALKILGNFEYKFQDMLQQSENLPLVMKHSHGDLVANNIFGDESPILIDWTNGGNHLFTYDLVVPEIYSPLGRFWTEIATGAWSNTFRTGICKSYYSAVLGLGMTTNVFRLHALVNLLEFLSKNYRRHQEPSDITEGMKVLNLVEQIIEKVQPPRSQE